VSESEQGASLQQMFASADTQLAGDTFSRQVMSRTDKLKRRRVIIRLLMALAVALAGIPLEDYVLDTARFLGSSLLELDDTLIAELLAPVNSVGGMLSLVLLALRAGHKRLFS
jgi:hypothetical protein